MQEHDSRGVPEKATSRRIFLKGALIAAATPAVALAPMAAETLSGLIAYHEDIWTQCKRAIEAEEALSATGPEFPHVRARELGPDHYDLGPEKKFHFAKSIDSYFDEREGAAQWHIDHRVTPKAAHARLERLRLQRQQAHEMLAARQAKRKEWEDASGLTAARNEAGRLGDIEIALDDKIMGWPIGSLDEARQVAGYLHRLHGNRLPDTEGLRLIASLLA